MNFNELKELIQIIDKSSLTGFSYQKDGMKLKVEKGADSKTVIRQASGVIFEELEAQQTQVAQPQAVETIETIAKPTVSDAVQVSESTTVAGQWISSPLVGIFYTAPSPDSEPFVAVGKQVKKGDVICIIEAMKVMNEITADKDGTVVAIKPENESLVAYGDELICIG